MLLSAWAAVMTNPAEALLVASNIFFIVPAIKSCFLHRWTRAFLYFCMIFASGFYHTCNSFAGACVLPSLVHRKLDFFFAQWLIPVTALYLIHFPLRYAFLGEFLRARKKITVSRVPSERWCILLFGAVLFVFEAVFQEPFWLQVAVAGFSVLMIVAYWTAYVAYYATHYGVPRFPRYQWEAFLLFVLLTGVACSLFATQANWHNGYAWVHTIWHIAAAFGQTAVLCTRDAAPRNAAIDRQLVAAPAPSTGGKRVRQRPRRRLRHRPIGWLAPAARIDDTVMAMWARAIENAERTE